MTSIISYRCIIAYLCAQVCSEQKVIVPSGGVVPHIHASLFAGQVKQQQQQRPAAAPGGRLARAAPKAARAQPVAAAAFTPALPKPAVSTLRGKNVQLLSKRTMPGGQLLSVRFCTASFWSLSGDSNIHCRNLKRSLI